MIPTKAAVKRLVKSNNEVLTQDNVDLFFTHEVLRQRLVSPLSNFCETFVSTYALFKRTLASLCFYKEAYITQQGANLIFSTLFDTPGQKFMLVIYSMPNATLGAQDDAIAAIFEDFGEVKESEHTLAAEPLPAIVRTLIDGLIADKINGPLLRLKKIKAAKGNTTIVFHKLSLMIDLEALHGISIVAGFQY